MDKSPHPPPSDIPPTSLESTTAPLSVRPVPARGPDGYYRIPSATTSPTLATIDPTLRDAPSTSAPAPVQSTLRKENDTAEPRLSLRGSTTAAPRANGGEGAGATNNPVMAKRNPVATSARPSDADIRSMAEEQVRSITKRPVVVQPKHGEQREAGPSSGAGGAQTSIPRSTTPTGSPPRLGPEATWLPLRPAPPAKPLERPPRNYRPAGSSRPSQGSSSTQPHSRDVFSHPPRGNHLPPGREAGHEPYPPAVRGPVPGSQAPTGRGGAFGPHASNRAPNRRVAPYPPPSRDPHAQPPLRAIRPYIPPPEVPPNAEAGPSNARPAADYEGDTIMRDAAEGLQQEQRRSLRGRAARQGLAADGVQPAAGGSEMSVIAGVSASGKAMRIGGSVKIGTGPGGVQRKKTKGDTSVPNQDFCSSCRGVGRFLCCDGCPRSFHFMCLEPPLRVDELPEEDLWYCKKCRDEFAHEPAPSAQVLPSPSPRPSSAPGPSNAPAARPALKPIPLAFRLLIKRLDEENPSQFRLPEGVRNYFAGVAENDAGVYVEEEAGNRKIERKSTNDVRDLYVRDLKNARPVACYVCGGSSVPNRNLVTDPDPTWRPVVSCDYCALHWHLDCLSPPLTIVPNVHSGKKWMCPNHAEQVLPRRRTVKDGAKLVDVHHLNVPNNGNIVIVPDRPKPRLEYEDIVVNRQRYRVPEHIIQLDFFDRVKGRVRPPPPEKRKRSDSDSSLTSLTSVAGPTAPEDLEAANLIIGLASSSSSANRASTSTQVESAPVRQPVESGSRLPPRRGSAAKSAIPVRADPSAPEPIDIDSDEDMGGDHEPVIFSDEEDEPMMPFPSVVQAQPNPAQPPRPAVATSSAPKTADRSVPVPTLPPPFNTMTSTQPKPLEKPGRGMTKRTTKAERSATTPMVELPPVATPQPAPRASTSSVLDKGKGKARDEPLANGHTTISRPIMTPIGNGAASDLEEAGPWESDSDAGGGKPVPRFVKVRGKTPAASRVRPRPSADGARPKPGIPAFNADPSEPPVPLEQGAAALASLPRAANGPAPNGTPGSPPRIKLNVAKAAYAAAKERDRLKAEQEARNGDPRQPIARHSTGARSGSGPSAGPIPRPGIGHGSGASKGAGRGPAKGPSKGPGK